MQQPAIVHPQQNRVIHAFGDEACFHLTGAETGGQYTMFTAITPPGGGPPPHMHANEDELFLVLEGKVAFWKDHEWIEAGPGASAFMPRQVPHTFKNIGDTPLKMLVQTVPSGFENFFAEAAEEFAKPGGPDMERAVAIAQKHGISFVQP